MQQIQNQGKVQIEQILADGEPAVKVSIVGVGVRYYRFPTNEPGMAVGQWSDKAIRKPLDEQSNTNPDTYQDYLAWTDAFHRVYEAS